MSVKIEKLAPGEKLTAGQFPSRGKGKMKEFVLTLQKLNVGDSFLWPAIDSNMRNGIRIAAILLEAKFVSAVEGDGMRVMRIA